MKARRIIDRFLETLVIIIMTALVIDVVWNVISRYLLNSPSSFSVELASFLLIWIGLIGSAYASGKKEHIAIELFPQWVEKKGHDKKRKLDNLINWLIILFAFFVLIVGGIRLVYIVFEMGQVSSTMQIPMGIVYLCLPISGLLIIFYAAHEMIYGLPEDILESTRRD
ncbi:MAG: TRAP transporter small permease [Bacteroidota bacterium]